MNDLPKQSIIMPILQLIAGTVILGLVCVITMAPAWGWQPADVGMSKTVENVLLILVGYLFGSSVGGAKKDDAIAAVALATPAAPTPLPAPPAPVPAAESPKETAP